MNCSVVKKDLSALIMIGSSKSEKKEKKKYAQRSGERSDCVSNEVLIARFAHLAKFVPINHTVGAQVVR